MNIHQILMRGAWRTCGPDSTSEERLQCALQMAIGMLEGLLDEDETIQRTTRAMYTARLQKEGEEL